MFNLDFNPCKAKAAEHCTLWLRGIPRFGGGVGIEPTSVYLQIFIRYGFRLIAMTLLPGLPP